MSWIGIIVCFQFQFATQSVFADNFSSLYNDVFFIWKSSENIVQN